MHVKASIVTVPVQKLSLTHVAAVDHEQDFVSVEEPLQIRVNDQDVAITMRTPGHDRELAAGFLFTEGIVSEAAEIRSIVLDQRGAVQVQLADDVPFELGPRNFYMTSSCGVCGKASIDALRQAGACMAAPGAPVVQTKVLFALPDKLRQAQAVFEHTGGLHAAGLFNASGALVSLREDVGRHNAVDKLIGQALLNQQLPLADRIIMLSGRISFELVQKAVMAGIRVVAAVGAPSSLAVETARRFGITLVGFLRDGRCNVYTGADRII